VIEVWRRPRAWQWRKGVGVAPTWDTPEVQADTPTPVVRDRVDGHVELTDRAPVEAVDARDRTPLVTLLYEVVVDKRAWGLLQPEGHRSLLMAPCPGLRQLLKDARLAIDDPDAGEFAGLG